MAAASSGASNKTDGPSAEEREAQINTLRQDFAKLIDSLGAAGDAKASALKDKARSQAQNAYAAAEDKALRAEQEISSFVRERPYAALGIAAGVGFLAALLARR